MSAEDRIAVAFQLAEARRRAGLKVNDVAEKANLDSTTISTYEARSAAPSESALERWYLALLTLARDRANDARVATNDRDHAAVRTDLG